MNSGSTKLYNVLMGNPTNGVNNSIGRTAGTTSDSSDPFEFFKKRGKSIENALGTTGASLISAIDTATENTNIEQRNKDYKDKLKNIAQKYGYNSMSDFYDASNAADRDILSKYNFDFDSYNAQRQEAADKNDQAKLDELDKYKLNFIESNITGEDANKLRNFTLGSQELRKQASGNLSDATKAAENWKNYRENSYVGQKVNQDRGKFLGSAVNTLSTAVDLTGLGANPLSNAIQGGVEGIADELEQNGLQNFDAGRAAQNVAIGAATGAVTGALNKGISNSLAKKGGNLFKGNNAITAGLNNLGSKTALGRGVSTIATGVGRGAVSGAVGGATGAGLSAALNGQDVLGSAVEGAKRGLTQGAAAGGIMSGANLALNNTPGVGKFMQDLNSAKTNWDNSGDTFDERLTNTLNSGDSAVGNWLNRQSQSRALATMGNIGNRVQNVDTATRTGDAWDRLAQQSGYNNYDEVIQRYMEANPGVELNPNGAAGQILTWLDENPNTPTTAAGWAKRAGERIVEDVNNSNLGMRVKDVSNELPEDIRNLAINDNAQIPDTRGQFGDVIEYARNNDLGKYGRNEIREIYESGDTNAIRNLENAWRENGLSDVIDAARDEFLNKPTVQTSTPQNVPRAQEEVIDLTKSFDNPGLEEITNRNKLQAVGKQLQNAAQTQKYNGVYGSLDSKTAERVAKTGAPQRLADLGVKPQDYNEYAKTSSYVNSVASDLAKRSNVKVNVPDLPDQLSAGKLGLPFNSEANLKTYQEVVRNIVPDGDAPGQYSAAQLLDASRRLSKMASGIKGTTDSARELRDAYNTAKYKLRDISTDAFEKSGVTGDATNAKIAEGLKNLGANQKVIDYYTEAVDGKAPTISDYIRRSSLFEQAREMGNQIDAVRYARSGPNNSTNPFTKIWRASGLDQPIETILSNTIAPAAAKVTDLAGKAIEGTGNLVAGTSSKLPTIDLQTPTPEITPTSQSLYNIIGRTEGEIQGDKARTAQYLANAANAANAQDNTLESMAVPSISDTTTIYNTMQGGSGTNTQLANTQQTATNSYFQPTGDYWTDLLGSAITMAIDANDVNAFTSLYSMYQDALASAQKTNSTTSEVKLTDKQRQANAAERALNDFENVEHNFAYDVSDIPILGNVANFGGNEYASKAEALALQIGYMLSGATVNKEEAKNIGMAYVPQPRDNEATRRSKLAQLRGIISDYQRTYAE